MDNIDNSWLGGLKMYHKDQFIVIILTCNINQYAIARIKIYRGEKCIMLYDPIAAVERNRNKKTIET